MSSCAAYTICKRPFLFQAWRPEAIFNRRVLHHVLIPAPSQALAFRKRPSLMPHGSPLRRRRPPASMRLPRSLQRITLSPLPRWAPLRILVIPLEFPCWPVPAPLAALLRAAAVLLSTLPMLVILTAMRSITLLRLRPSTVPPPTCSTSQRKHVNMRVARLSCPFRTPHLLWAPNPVQPSQSSSATTQPLPRWVTSLGSALESIDSRLVTLRSTLFIDCTTLFMPSREHGGWARRWG